MNPCHIDWIKMSCLLLSVSQSNCLIQVVDTNSHTESQTKQCRSGSVGFWRSQLIWIYIVWIGRAYPGLARPGLMHMYRPVLRLAACNLIRVHRMGYSEVYYYYFYFILFFFLHLNISRGKLELPHFDGKIIIKKNIRNYHFKNHLKLRVFVFLQLTSKALIRLHRTYRWSFLVLFIGLSNIGSMSNCRFRGGKFESQVDDITLLETDYEIISAVILPFLLFQEGQLSVTGKSMWTTYWLMVERTKPA